MADIRLDLERSGGFAGLAVAPKRLDVSALSADQADEVARLIAEIREPPPRSVAGGGHPDATNYELTIRSGGTVQRVRFDDVTATPELHRLREYIDAHGAPR
jgi:hypothetical protein